jgi:asparagine synthase (glutamine-hydrolysing)
MCGFIGSVGKTPCSKAILDQASQSIAHRGPDEETFFSVKTKDSEWYIDIAFRRLSIIDLTGGSQPMSDQTGRYHITFNGEIYNFQALRERLQSLGHDIRSDSDTEVLLYSYIEWKENCASYLVGMYAFAIWDSEEEALFVARDRFGKKPLYYACDPNGGIVFGSEIAGLMQYPQVSRKLDISSLRTLLAWRYAPGPHTLFEDIKKLPPASRLVWRDGAIVIDQYWTQPDAHIPPPAHGEPNPLQAFDELLSECVADRLISDVPFGAFLSGGIDSSTIVAFMRRHLNGSELKTFSVGFGYPDYDELDYAREVATQFETNHTEVIVLAGDIPKLLPLLTKIRGAPITEPSDVALFLLAKEANKSVKMVLTGEGADELLGGYPKHWAEPYSVTYQKLVPNWLRSGLVEPLVQGLPFSFRRLKTLAKSMALENQEDRYPRWFGGLSQAEADSLISPSLRGQNLSHPLLFAHEQPSTLRQMLYFDQVSWLPDNILERGDRMTMAASIEARMPFMDHRLYEFIAQLSDDWRVRRRTGKWILRKLMEDRLPARILNRPKVGFRVPIARWFLSELEEWVDELLLGDGSNTRQWANMDQLSLLLTQHKEKKQNNEKILWTLVSTEIFFRTLNPEI